MTDSDPKLDAHRTIQGSFLSSSPEPNVSPPASENNAPSNDATKRLGVDDGDVTQDTGQRTQADHGEVTLPSESRVGGLDPGATVDVDASSGSQYGLSLAEETLNAAPSGQTPPDKRALGPALGRFRIVRLLGQGAFGSVYLTHDPQLDREVAVKVAKTGVLVTQDDRDRFLREARAAAKLRHQNIVPVYEFGQIGSSSFIAYEYIRGSTLKNELRQQGKFSREKACRVVAKIADALHYAHSQNIVHRDVKPDNILLDEHGEPHVADFGCARQQDSSAGALTIEGSLMGTPAYMSPEQATGYSHQADARSDIWSVGVILEELMTGKRPFTGKINEILLQIGSGDFKGIRHRDPGIPKDLETIWSRCLAHNPEERFASAQDLADELRRWLNGEPIQSRRISLLARTYRWAKRNRDIAALIALVVLVSVAGALISTALYLQAVRAESNRLRAEREHMLNQVAQLTTAEASEVPSILGNLQVTDQKRRGVAEILRQQTRDPSLSAVEQSRLRASLLTLDSLGVDRHALAAEILQDLLQAPAAEFRLSRAALQLQDVGASLSGDLWTIAEDPESPRERRFRSLCALANFESSSERWDSLAVLASDLLLAEPPSMLGAWSEELKPIRDQLLAPLQEAFTVGDTETRRRVAASVVIGQLFLDQPELLCRLLLQAGPNQTAELASRLRARSESVLAMLDQWEFQGDVEDPYAKAQLAIVRLGLGNATAVEHLPDELPDAHAAWIHRVAQSGVDPAMLLARLQSRPSPREIQNIVLAMGQYQEDALPKSARDHWMPVLESLYCEHPHAGVHYAIDWLLRRWDRQESLMNMRQAWLGQPPLGERQWFTDTVTIDGDSSPAILLEIDFVIVEPAEFLMGLQAGETPLAATQPAFPRRVPRRYAISTCEITNRQFLCFPQSLAKSLRVSALRYDQLAGDPRQTPLTRCLSWGIAQAMNQRQHALLMTENNRGVRGADLPVKNVTWNEAIAFCRWLSDQQGRVSGLPSLDEIRTVAAQQAPLILDSDVLNKPGFRLPTASEWELACRAGTSTTRFLGDRLDFASFYVGSVSSSGALESSGQRKPNPWGLFDMLGNVDEWCLNNYRSYKDDQFVRVDDGGSAVSGAREVRGGSYESRIEDIRAAYQAFIPPFNGSDVLGFRVVRTLVDSE